MKEFLYKFITENWVILLVIAGVYYIGVMHNQAQNAEEIAGIRVEKERVINKAINLERDIKELSKQIQDKESQIANTEEQLSLAHEKETAALKYIAKLEDEKDTSKLSVQMIRDDDDTVAEFRSTFPDLSNAADMGVLDVDSDGLILTYFTLPLHFIDTFIINKNELDIVNMQLEEYGGITEVRATIDQLNSDKAGLLRKVATLEASKFTACDGVRREMTQTLLERQDKHIATLEKPRFDWSNGMSYGAGLLTCAAGAFFLNEF